MLFCLLYLAQISGQTVIRNFYFDKSGRKAAPASAWYFRQNTDTAQLYVSFYRSDSGVYFHGKIKAISDTSETHNVYMGLCTWYYRGGAVKKECYYNDNGMPDGAYSEFYESGDTLKKAFYANGALQGTYAEFYPDGIRAKSAMYDQNLLQGEYLEFYEDGSIAKRSAYNKGKMAGGRYTEYNVQGVSASVFNEDFLDNSNNWPLSEAGGVISKIKIGGLQVFNTSGKDHGSLIPFTIDSAAFSIETKVNSNYIVKSCRAGFVFGFKDWNNYQYFLVSQKAYYVGSVVNGVQSRLLDSLYAPELSPVDWNKLRLEKGDDSLSVYINGVFKVRCAYTYTPGDRAGFFVSKNGAALFDNLEVKQYNKLYKPRPVTKETFVFSGKRYALNAHQAGLVISKKGYVATTLPQMLHANIIIIKAYINDSLKLFTASRHIIGSAQDLVILKINDLGSNALGEISYSFLAVDHILLDAGLLAFSLEANSDPYRVLKSEGVLKSYACYENFTSTFESQFNNNNNNNKNIGPGAILFTAQGELAGIAQGWKKDRLSSTKAHLLRDLVFNATEKVEVSKEKMEATKIPKEPSAFQKGIYRNIVEIIAL